MFASNRLCLLISINLFPQLCADMHEHPALLLQSSPICSEWPAVVQLQHMCGKGAVASGSPATRDKLGVNEAKGCGSDVIAFWGRSEA